VFALLVICGVRNNVLVGQQLPILTQFTEYGSLINPAFISHDNYHFQRKRSAGIAFRDQWSQIPDRPTTVAVRYEEGTSNRRGVNLVYGGTILHDQIGVFTTTIVKGRTSVYIKPNSNRNRFSALAVGLSAGLGQYVVNLSDLAYVQVDPILFSGRGTILYPDLGLGLTYILELENEDYVQLGFSVPQIFSLDHTYSNDRKTFDIRRVPHQYLTASYYKTLTEDTFLEFSGWVKKVKNVPLNYDIIMRYRFSENMWLGAGANNGGIIHTEIGLIYNQGYDRQYKLSYAFNPTFYAHSIIFGNIHELNLSLNF